MTNARIKQLYRKIDKLLDVKALAAEIQYFPIVDLTPKQLLTWSKGLPPPIYGGLSVVSRPVL